MECPSKKSLKYKVLRIGLVLGGCGWLISFAFTFTSWAHSHEQLVQMGMQPMAHQPLLNYWLKMASAAFGCLGIIFLITSYRPEKFKHLNYMLAGLSAFVGSVILFTALSENLTHAQHPTFIIDIIFCYLTATLIFLPHLGNPKYQDAIETSGIEN